MNQLIFIVFLFLFISSCNDELSAPPISQQQTFDLARVETQYANIALEIADIGEQAFQNGSALAVTLSTPLNPKNNVQSFFKVSDKQGQAVKGNWIISANGLVAFFPETEPSTTYTIDIYQGLTAATGMQLKTTTSQQVVTRKMPSQVSFASQGSILPAKLAKGLPVISVNINEIDIDFHRIKADKISHFIKTWSSHSGRSNQSSYYLQQYAPYTDLIYTGRFNLDPPKNTRYTTHIDLSAIDKIKQAGIYLAVMKPAGSYSYEQQVTFFTISDLGLHARMYPDELDVQLSSLATGEALSDINLTLLDANENVLDKATSNQQGQAKFISPSYKARLLIARNKDNIALLRLNSPALDLSEFDATGRSYKPIEIFTYSARDLYRPGETIKFKALLRDADAQSISSPPLNAVIKRADGQKIKYFTWYPETGTPGFYQTEYSLPTNAMTGKWTLELKTTKKNKQQFHFQVEAFLPERMELILGNPQEQKHWTNSNDTLNIPISGQYLYGAPAANNRLSSKVILKPARHPVKSLKDYFFGMEDDKPPVEFFELDDLKMDKQGLATLKVASRWNDVKNTPYLIKIIASLFETGGRPVTRTIDYHLWPQNSLIGIRPHIKLDDIPANKQLSFDLIQSDSEGNLQGNTEVVATLIKERRDYYWEYSSAEGWHYEYTGKNFKAFEQRIHLNNKTATTISVPVDWGSYLLIVKDTKTKQSTSLRFQAGHGWFDQQNSASARPDRVVLKLDKKTYQAGETAQLHITPPYTGNGFVMVENSEKPLWFKRLSIPAEGLNITIPINKDWNRHDLYISTIVFRPGDAKEKITPNRAVGLLHLPLNRNNRQLAVKIKTSGETIRPEQKLTTPIQISGLSANKETFITLAAVDVGVLNITNFKTPDPHQWFFKPRRYSVEHRDIYNKIIELSKGGLTKPRFGGDADQHAGGARPDSSVQIVSLFSEVIKVDPQGNANITLDIPDFNGRLRLMAVAFNDHQFGSAEIEITVAAPIIAEMSLPRFLASGDTSTLTLDVRNQSGQDQSISLEMLANSPVNMQTGEISFYLKDQEKQIFHFPITAEHAFGQSQINLSLHNAENSITINRQRHLGVRPAYPGIRQVQRKVISGGEQIKIIPPLQNLVLASVNSELNISSQPPINIKQHIKSLLRYPYGCLEQTISSTYPWLFITDDNLDTLGLDKTRIHNKLINIKDKPLYIDSGISILAGMQRSNGSFGLWSNRDSEQHWLTAYAADFLIDTREKGFKVPEELLNKTLLRLTHYLNHRGNMYGERYSQVPGHYSFAYKAYAAYVLSRLNRAPLGSLRTLFDHHRKDLKSALPLTHLGIALFTQGDKNRGMQAIKESVTKPRDNLLYLSDYGSRLRDISVMTYLLNKHPVAVEESKTLIFQLMDELNNRKYLSTQERNALFRTGIQLLSKEKNSWQGRLIIDNSTTKLQQKQDYNEQYTGSDTPQSIQFYSENPANHPVYFQFEIDAYPKTAPEMQMEKIKVERNYYDLEGKSITPGHHKTGDVLLVHLNIRAEQRIQDALVVDLIPAGFELENQNLSNSLKIDSFKIADRTIENMQQNNRIKHQEYLDDRFVAALDLHKNNPQHLFYLIRAVTKGQYTNPPPFVEDMYRPYIRAIGRNFNTIEVVSE